MNGLRNRFGGGGKRVAAFLGRHLFSVVLIAGMLLLYGLYFLPGFHLRVQLESVDPGIFHVYWADSGEGFSEDRQNSQRYEPGQNEFVVPLGRFGRGGRLRLDPLDRPGLVRIIRVELRGPFAAPVSLGTESPAFDEGTLLAGDWEEVRRDSRAGVLLRSDGADPQVLWEGVRWERVFLRDPSLWVLLALAAGIVWFERRFPRAANGFVRRMGFVPVVLLFVLGANLSIALSSPKGIHPDEFVHLEAGEFYQERWLVPRPDDPEVLPSYSDYGVSRLNGSEVSYWFAGKFSKLLESTGLDASYLRLRLFNLCLFGALVVCAFANVRNRFLLLPLLLFPQAFYLFSYFNSDGFALAVSYFFVFAAVGGRGPVNRVLAGRTGGRPGRWIAAGALLSLPLGFLKINFWLLGGFLLGYLCVRLAFAPRECRRTAAVGVAVFLVTPIAGNLLWNGVAQWRADFERGERVWEMRLETAKEIYNPGRPVEELYKNVYLKDRGVPFTDLFTRLGWTEILFASSFGNYGYFGIRPTPLYFERLQWATGLFAFAFLVPTAFRLRRREALVYAGALFSCFVVFLAAAYNSWANDFQAQGRYLAPVLPVLGVALWECRKRFSWWWLGVPVGSLILLALYSYFFVAVPDLG